MGIVVNLTWGDSWRQPKEGLSRVIKSIQETSAQSLPKPVDADDPSVDIYIYVSGSIWQHGEEASFRLGSLSHRGRAWMRVMIYVPDTVQGEEESVAFFQETLDQVAIAVEARLQRRRPEWPIDELVAQVRQLRPAA